MIGFIIWRSFQYPIILYFLYFFLLLLEHLIRCFYFLLHLLVHCIMQSFFPWFRVRFIFFYLFQLSFIQLIHFSLGKLIIYIIDSFFSTDLISAQWNCIVSFILFLVLAALFSCNSIKGINCLPINFNFVLQKMVPFSGQSYLLVYLWRIGITILMIMLESIIPRYGAPFV